MLKLILGGGGGGGGALPPSPHLNTGVAGAPQLLRPCPCQVLVHRHRKQGGGHPPRFLKSRSWSEIKVKLLLVVWDIIVAPLTQTIFRCSLAGQTSRLVGVVSESLSLATPTGRLAPQDYFRCWPLARFVMHLRLYQKDKR